MSLVSPAGAMLSEESGLVLASRPYCVARSQAWRSGLPGVLTSAAQALRQAAALSAVTPDQPRPAARSAAVLAEVRGSREVSEVSTPTYFSKVYERPALTRVVRAPSVPRWTIAPSVPVPSARNVPSSATVTLRAPRSSSLLVTVAVPLQCGVIRRRTAPVWASERSASTS